MIEEDNKMIARTFGLKALEKKDKVNLDVVREKEMDDFLRWEGTTFTLEKNKTAEELEKLNDIWEEQLEILSIKKSNIYSDGVLHSKIAVISTNAVFFYLVMFPYPVTNESYVIVEGAYNPHEAGLKYFKLLNSFSNSGYDIDELKDFNDMHIVDEEDREDEEE